MKVKEVLYHRLFTIGEYNNEKIGFRAEVGEDDNPDQVTGHLFIKVLKIEQVLSKYREMLSEVEHCKDQRERYQSLLDNTKIKADKMKIDLAEIKKKLDAGEDIDERLRHACSAQSYKSVREQIENYTEDLKAWDERLDKAIDNEAKLEKRIKEGNFTIEGTELPKTRLREELFY